MGRRKSGARAFPKLVRHKGADGKFRGRVRINGKDRYLGYWDDPQTEATYLRGKAHFLVTGELIPELLASGRRTAGGDTRGVDPPQSLPVVTVQALILRFLRHADRHYVKNGRQTAEVRCFKSALRPLRQLYGGTPVDEFGPLALQAVRAEMTGRTNRSGKPWTRKFINKSVDRVRHVFRWGVSQELVKPETLAALESVHGLQAGRTTARETDPRDKVPQEHIEAVKKFVPRRTADIIDLMLRTAARPGEVLALTTAMIDRTGQVWTAELSEHKMDHRGTRRILIFDEVAQALLIPYLNPSSPDSRIFAIKTGTLSDSVKRACEKADIAPRWTPHWLRHTAATRLRAEASPDIAQVFCGHARLSMTEHYARPDVAAAIAFAAEIGSAERSRPSGLPAEVARHRAS